MTIDERIEALTQSVELLASLHRDNEQLLANHDNMLANHERLLANHERLLANHDDLLGQVVKAIGTLTRIAEGQNGRLRDHDQRIDNLEGR